MNLLFFMIEMPRATEEIHNNLSSEVCGEFMSSGSLDWVMVEEGTGIASYR